MRIHPPVGKTGHAPGLRRRADRTAHPRPTRRARSSPTSSDRRLREHPRPATYPLTPSRLPDAGQVTCVGGAEGVFRFRYGSDWTDVEAPVDVEALTEIIAITADFADWVVRDRTGCVGDLELEREYLCDAPGFRRGMPQAPPTGYGRRAAGGALPRRRSMRELSTQLRMRSAIGKSTGAMPVPGRARLAAVRRRPSPTPERDLRQFRRVAPGAMLRCASR